MSLIPTSLKTWWSVTRMQSHLLLSTVPCQTCVHGFRWRKQRRFRKWRIRSMRPNSIIISATIWLSGFWATSKSTLRYPIKIGYWTRKCSKASSILGKGANVVGGKYALTTGVLCVPLPTSQLTTFSPWMRLNSRIYPVGWSHEPRATTTCNPPELSGRSVKQTKLYPSRL